jgi:hypothetical protein
MDTNNNGLNEQLIRQLFIPYEAQQIINIPILYRTKEDSITWAGLWMGATLLKMDTKPL